MSSSRQVPLRYILIPADDTLGISELSVKIENQGKLSCDVAYFLPALLNDGPSGFNSVAGWTSVLPFPTFNECQKADVPLFVYKKNESRENARARTLLNLLSEKLPKKLNTFHGDTLVFWRKSVDETRHQMKLTDFTFSDVLRLLGPEAYPNVTPGLVGETPVLETPKTLKSQAAPKRLETLSLGADGVRNRSDPAKGSLESERSPGGQTLAGGQNQPGDQPSAVMQEPSVTSSQRSATSVARDFDNFAANPLLAETQNAKLSDASRGGADVIIAPGASSASRAQQQLAHHLQPENLASQSPARTSPKQTDSPAAVLRRFLDLLSQQVPAVANAAESLLAENQSAMAIFAASGNNQRLLDLRNIVVESEARERRLQGELLKVTSDLSQMTSINTSLNRQYQALQQDLISAQTSAQRYKDDGAKLLRDFAGMRDKVVWLQNRNSFLENELRASGRIIPIDNPVMKELTSLSPSHEPPGGSGSSRRALHHMKNGGATNNPLSTMSLSDSNVPRRSSASSPVLGGRWEPQNAARLQQPSDFLGRQFLVTQVYTPELASDREQFAQVNEGDIVTVDREDISGWWWITTEIKANSGWYPYSFLMPV